MSKGTTGDRSFKRPWSKCEQSETLVRVRESLFKVVSYNFICGDRSDFVQIFRFLI
jgi:hypothetical protein